MTARSSIRAVLAGGPGNRASGKATHGKRASVALDSQLWDGFFKEAVTMTPPAAKAFKLSRTITGKMPGTMKTVATSTGVGQLTSLGRSGTSAIAAPTPTPISISR